MTNTVFQEAESKFVAFLKSKRLRKTPERMAILEEVCSLGAHFEVEDVHVSLEEKGYHVSRATVYSTMELLCLCGIVRRLLFNMHHSCYELTGRSHIHLVCTECGDVREVDDPEALSHLESLRPGGFSVAYCSTTLFGLCPRCARRARAVARKKREASTPKEKKT